MKQNNKRIILAQKVIIVNNMGQILTIKRSNAYNRPLTWDLPGGNLDFGEKLKQSILREVKEETSLSVKNLSFLGITENLDNKDLFRITICYVAKAITSKIILSHEHIDFKWVKPNEFLKLNAYKPHKEFVKKYKKNLPKVK